MDNVWSELLPQGCLLIEMSSKIYSEGNSSAGQDNLNHLSADHEGWIFLYSEGREQAPMECQPNWLLSAELVYSVLTSFQ